ncbi:MAG: hypothetical protein HOE87_00515 [Candidatus Magasanikbacteria bacterium]|nr:hypothetical protein [Candidatus Magasanikbacteria bacterium]
MSQDTKPTEADIAETLRQLSADGETGGVKFPKLPSGSKGLIKISGACC